MRYLIPIASADDLFPRKEFHFPKPLIEVDGVPMIERVIDNIRLQDPEAYFIFVVRAQDCREFSFDHSLREASNGRCDIVKLEKPTAGAVCSALLAVELIDDARPLVVCNGDQVIEDGIAAALQAFANPEISAGVITFASVHPRWSYVRLGEDGWVVEAAEKRVVSRRAIAGFYYFSTGSSFVNAARRSIMNERSVQGRFYIAPVLNEIVLDGGRIAHFDVSAEHYQSLFSPQRVESYEHQIQGRRLMHSPPTAPLPITVVIPMAGLGSRFSNAGYDKPKPFIDVAGKPMIERVMDNLKVPGAHFVLISRREHLEAEPAVVAALESRGDVTFAPIDLVTEGAACTVLTARSHWRSDAPLLIANCDQIVDFDCSAYVQDAQARQLDGSILVFKDPTRNIKWSFARLDANSRVMEVKEKIAISDIATVGLYYFSKAQSFADSAIDMISRNERVNGEFYVCPVYNYAISNRADIGIYEIPASAMHGIGTPEDLNSYLALRYSK